MFFFFFFSNPLVTLVEEDLGQLEIFFTSLKSWYWSAFCVMIFQNPVQYREHRVKSREAWAGVLSLPFICCGTWGQSLPLPGPRFTQP